MKSLFLGLAYFWIAISCTEKMMDTPSTPEQSKNPTLKSASMYYISPNGNDANVGSQAAPFKTIQKAADLANPGDVIIVGDGTYTSTSTDQLVNLTKSGTASSYITIRAQNTGKAILNGQNNSTREGFNIQPGVGYINIEGFEITGFSLSGIFFMDWNSGAYAVSPVHDVGIRNNNIHHIGKYCTDTASESPTGITLFHSKSVILEQNKIHDIGRYAPGENGCSCTTENYKNHDHAIYMNGVNGVTVQNNIFYNNNKGESIHLYSYNDVPSSNVSIINNTFAFGNPYYPGGHLMLWDNMSNVTIANNIFYSQIGSGMQIYQGSYTYSNVLVTKNITLGGNGSVNSGTASGVTIVSNMDATDPKMTNPTAYDFSLTSSSTAINTGNNYGLSTDYLGNTRVGLPDIGALEFGGATATVYYNTQVSKTATKNDCGTGYTGSTVTYTVKAGAYSSTVSQADADSKGAADLSTNAQTYANTNGTCTAAIVYYNKQVSATATKNNCGTGYTGSTVTYTVAASKYSSTVSQADADSKAAADLSANTQTYANSNGTCTTATVTYYNVQMSATATKASCAKGYKGSTVTYTVPAGKYSSTISLADANAKATNDLNTNKQAYADANGTCTKVRWWWQR